MAKLYKITTKRGFPAEERRRAGLTIPRGGQVVTELTKDQKEAIENDTYLEITEAAAGEQTEAAVVSEGAGVASNATNGADFPGEQPSEEDEADEDQSAGEEEADGSEDQGTEDTVEENQSAPAGDATAQGVTPTEPVSGEAGAGADEGADSAEDTNTDEESSAAAEGQESVENSQDSESAPTVDELVRDNDRPTLDKMAADLGIADADKMQNKVEVATAIVEKRA